MNKQLPVLNIGHFHNNGAKIDLYADVLSLHAKKHKVIAKPHKHDFFMALLFTKGSGTHEVDFNRYDISPGALFLLSPGQSHCWTLSEDAEGIIVFHSREFFDKGFTGRNLRDFPFFSSIYNSPLLKIEKSEIAQILGLFKSVLQESRDIKPMKNEMLQSLLSLLYIEAARLYVPKAAVKNEQYLSQLRKFEDLLDVNFRQVKLPSAYAAMIHITERHLNRICKTCLDKTPSELILDRNMLEAKRSLMRSSLSVADVAAQLGYEDQSYFSRLFKKKTGQTPREFMSSYA